MITPTQKKVLRMVCRDMKNAEMADQLGLTMRTVERLRASLMHISKAKGPVGLFRWAVRNRLVKMH